MDLPVHIRNRIYRYLVAAKWVSVRRPNWTYLSSETEGLPTGHPPDEDDDTTIGTIRCQNPWTETIPFQMAILRTSHQVYDEALNILQNENVWIKVEVNREDFGQDMRNRGFAVIKCGDVDHVVPNLKVWAFFPSLQPLGQRSVFFMGSAGLFWLPRALWAIKGMEEMFLRLELNPNIVMSARIEADLMYPFYQIKGIKKLILRGVNSQAFKATMPDSLTTPYTESSEVLLDLQPGTDVCGDFIELGDDAGGADSLEAQLAFMADCERLLRRQILTADEKVWSDIRELCFRSTYDLASIRMRLGEYERVVKYADHAMRITPISGVTNSERFLIRGTAYAKMRQDSKALRDLLDAQRLMPENKFVIQELSNLKNSLDPDPLKALEAFKNLRIVVKKEKMEEQRVFEESLRGKFVIKNLWAGHAIIEDWRSLP